MTLALFTPTPHEGDTLALPGGATVPARMVDAVPSTGETIVVLGIAPAPAGAPAGTTGGSLYGVVTIDELGIITGHTLDELLPCPYQAGDRIEVVA
ncbi:hypothetical protein [Janibacter terrae]|uniref:hypothetical protein n=1 Tax=Janibacter terrae TaxID=103817 RepID=UPI0031F8AE4B